MASAGGLALAAALFLEPPSREEAWALPVLAAISWALTHFPYRIAPQRQTTIEELGLCLSLFLMPLSALVPGIVAGYLISALLQRTPEWRLAFNAGIRAVSATCALLLVRWLDPGTQELPVQIAVAFGASALYLVSADVAVCWLRCRRTESPFWPSLLSTLALGSGPWLGASSSGIIIALAANSTPWVLPVGALSAAYVIQNSNRRYRYREDGRKLRSLHIAGEQLNAASSRDQAEAVVRHAAQALLHVAEAELRDRPPADRELGVRLQSQDLWLVVPERSQSPFTEDENDTHSTLAGMAESALRRIELVAELERQSLEDHLTGAGNRRHFERVLGELAHDKVSFSLVLFDIDLFKEINDEWGHDTGDQALLRLAHVVRESLGVRDLLFRIGGDEFVVLLPGVPAQDAVERVRMVQRRMASLELNGSTPPGLRISAGVAEYPGAADAPGSLLRAADKALYEAKRRGRNEVVLVRRDESAPGYHE
jgi:diguanylate cyclase (GGDEF)-like protein